MEETRKELDMRLEAIDNRVRYLEITADKHPDASGGIYDLIQKLMDERDELFKKKMQLA